MSTIVLRLVKGTPLTNAELDANFSNLNTDKLEAGTTATLTNKTINLSSNTFVATSAQMATAVSDKTGSGALVFADSPTFVTPSLGTPASGVVTNLTGTASININGTVGATTANTGAFTTLTTSSTVTLNGGTANGVAYLNGSKVLTTGSALTFDGVQTFKVRQNTAGTGNYSELILDIANTFSAGGQSYLRNISLNGGNSSTALAFGVNADGGGAPSEQMRLTSTGLGIGTSSPGGKVDIIGATNGYALKVGDGTRSGGLIPSSTGGIALYTPDTTPLSFWTNNAERMRLDSSGNVGIGTSSPTQKLHVAGNTITGNLYFGTSSASAGTLASDSGSSGGRIMLWGSTSPGAGLVDIATPVSAPITFATNAIERARITASGNLGIGTSSPTSKLQLLQSSTTAYGFISNTPTVGLTANSYVNMAYFANGRGASNDGLRIVNVRDSTGSGIGNWETESYRIRRSVDSNDAGSGIQEEIVFGINILAFSTGGGERARIDSAGQVGIGITPYTSQGNLQVWKNITGGSPATSGNTDVNQVAMIGGGGVGLGIGLYPSGAVWMQPRSFSNFAGNYNMVLLPNGGNLGIGTVSLGYKLNVGGGRTTLVSDGNQYALGLGYTGGVGVWLGADSGNTDLVVSDGGGSERFRVISNGTLQHAGGQYRTAHSTSGNIVNPPSNKWYRLASFAATNAGQSVEFIFAILGQHILFRVKFSKTTANSQNYGGGILEVELLGSYLYGAYHPYKWRVVEGGTNAASHIDIQFPDTTGSVTVSWRVQALNSWAPSLDHATFPMTDMGTGAGGYGVSMGSGAGEGWNKQWFKLNSTNGKFAYLDNSLTMFGNQTASSF